MPSLSLFTHSLRESLLHSSCSDEGCISRSVKYRQKATGVPNKFPLFFGLVSHDFCKQFVNIQNMHKIMNQRINMQITAKRCEIRLFVRGTTPHKSTILSRNLSMETF
eukprot:sb/3477586/